MCQRTVDRVGAQLPGRMGPRKPSDAQPSVETSVLALATHLKMAEPKGEGAVVPETLLGRELSIAQECPLGTLHE